VLHFDGQRFRNGRTIPWYAQVGAYCAVPLLGRTVDPRDARSVCVGEYEERIRRLAEIYGKAENRQGAAMPRQDVIAIEREMERTNGNREEVAERFGLSLRTLTHYLSQYGLLSRWKKKPGPPKGCAGTPGLPKGTTRAEYETRRNAGTHRIVRANGRARYASPAVRKVDKGAKRSARTAGD
jgi:hypothetical protein